jgi:hypothetical protein
MVREIEPSNLGHQLHEKRKGGYGKGKKENCKKKGNLRMERCGLKARKRKTVGSGEFQIPQWGLGAKPQAGRHSAEDRPYLLKTYGF